MKSKVIEKAEQDLLRSAQPEHNGQKTNIQMKTGFKGTRNPHDESD